MKVLVVGGAGYIGSHAVRELVKEGNDVVVLDALYTGHRKAVDRRYFADARIASLQSLQKTSSVIACGLSRSVSRISSFF